MATLLTADPWSENKKRHVMSVAAHWSHVGFIASFIAFTPRIQPTVLLQTCSTHVDTLTVILPVRSQPVALWIHLSCRAHPSIDRSRTHGTYIHAPISLFRMSYVPSSRVHQSNPNQTFCTLGKHERKVCSFCKQTRVSTQHNNQTTTKTKENHNRTP